MCNIVAGVFQQSKIILRLSVLIAWMSPVQQHLWVQQRGAFSIKMAFWFAGRVLHELK